MNLPALLARHLREVHFGGNWTASNLRDNLNDLNWEQATRKLHDFNTIAALVYHMNYYVGAVSCVLMGNPLRASDQFSFDVPAIQSQEDWNNMLEKTWSDAGRLATLVEELPVSMLEQTFADERYGSYHRNILGVIEHIHYHLGQIVLIRKLVLPAGSN
jgi:hypothetical protein